MKRLTALLRLLKGGLRGRSPLNTLPPPQAGEVPPNGVGEGRSRNAIHFSIDHRHFIAGVITGCLLLNACTAPRQRYEMRQDLGIYFTNADAVTVQLREAMRRRDWQITVSYQSHRDNMEALGTIVRELMEQALSETDSPEEGDYLRHQYGGYELQYTSRWENEACHDEVRIRPQYYTTAAQEAQVTASVHELLQSFGFTGQTSNYEKVRTIYDYVVTHVRYDEIHARNPQHHLKTTAYAALMQKQAVCQGYAVLLYRLLREEGISARVITGTANGEYHAWNIVCLDGLYYNLDATWDSQHLTSDWFLLPDAAFPDHTRDAVYADAAFYAAYPMADQAYAPT